MKSVVALLVVGLRRTEMRSNRPAWSSIGLLALAACIAATPARGSEHEEKAVLEATAQFYAALNAMFTGDLGPMKAVWSHADDVTYMGPGGGLQIGWVQVLASWEEQAARKLGGEVQLKDMQVTVGRDIAITQGFEKGQNVDAEGRAQKVSIRATNLFRKEDGRWKMIGHHADLLTFLAE